MISDKHMSEIKVRHNKFKDKIARHVCKYHKMMKEISLAKSKGPEQIEIEEYLFKDKLNVGEIGAHLL